MAEAISAAFDTATTTDLAVEAPIGADPGLGTETGSEGTAQTDTDTSTTAGGEPGSDTAKDDEELPDPSKEELAAMPTKQRHRVQQLLEHRKGLRQEVNSLTPDATSYRAIRSYMANHKLTDEAVAELFQIGADLQSGDPVRLKAFVDRVTPRLQLALEATGQALPTDLRGRVDSGEMTEGAALEVAQVRHQATAAQVRAEQATQAAQTVVTTQVQQSVHKAVSDWHQQTRQTDPDFDLKLDAMTLAAKAIVAENGHPKNPAQAVEFARAAYDHANRLVRQVQPQKAPTRPTPSNTASANRSGVRAVPTSLADAIGQAFDAATRG